MRERAEASYADPVVGKELQAKRKDLEMDFLKEDIPSLMRESKEGIVRVRKIVQDLKDFSHVDATPQWSFANLNQGIDSTLNVVNNEVKYKADIIKEYGDIPQVQCLPSEINQVIMNLVVNAAHAIGAERGKIWIRTGVEGELVWIEVVDNGSGIPKDVVPHIFDPFYTTKPVEGTGLGLSLSYGIIQKHHGQINVQSEVGKGTKFRVTLPLLQAGNTDPNNVQANETSTDVRTVLSRMTKLTSCPLCGGCCVPMDFRCWLPKVAKPGYKFWRKTPLISSYPTCECRRWMVRSSWRRYASVGPTPCDSC